VNITGGSDYTLANSAISANYHSYAVSPQGYPGTFNYAPTLAGVTSPTVTEAKFAINGKTVTIWFDVQGTSNSTSFSMNAPVTAGALAINPIVSVDNGTAQSTPGRAEIFGASGSSTIDFSKNLSVNSNDFTNTGQKEAIGTLQYSL